VQAEKNAAAEIADIGRQYEDFKTKVMDATTALFTFAATQESGAKKASLPPAPTSGGKGKEDKTDLQIAKNNVATELELERIALATKKDLLDQEVSAGTISKQQELAALRDLVNQKQVIELKALEEEKALYEQGSTEYAAIQNKEKIVVAQTQQEIQKLVAQSAAEQKKEYDKVFSGIKSAMDGMVTGILQGTQTLNQALAKMADNILIKFAQMGLNDVLDWGRKQLLKVAESEKADAAIVASNAAKNAAINSADIAASGASNAMGATKLIKEIESSAAATYAGVFAFLAPELGPAAAVPAGISAAAVGAMTGLVSLDVGAWSVPQNMPAYLHAGEMVVPQNFASGLRDGGGIGGGGNFTININAIDTQTGTQFLKQNAHIIAQAVAGQGRNFNPSLRP
jgi:hypothetical protein